LTQTATSKPRGKHESLFVAIVILLWAAAFGVYFVNSPAPSLWGLSSAYAYSLVWWIVALLAFIAYAAYDLMGG
jgi:hypothetical protein